MQHAIINVMVQTMAMMAVLLGRFAVRPDESMGPWQGLQQQCVQAFVLTMDGGMRLKFDPRFKPSQIEE